MSRGGVLRDKTFLPPRHLIPENYHRKKTRRRSPIQVLTTNYRYGDNHNSQDSRTFRLPHLAILRTADDTSLAIANDLLRHDWLGRLG